MPPRKYSEGTFFLLLPVFIGAVPGVLMEVVPHVPLMLGAKQRNTTHRTPYPDQKPAKGAKNLHRHALRLGEPLIELVERFTVATSPEPLARAP